MIKTSLFYPLILTFWLFAPGLSTCGAERPAASAAAEPKPAPGVSRPPIVILGASYAAGLQNSLLAGYTVINKGIGGQQSHEMLARFDTDVVQENPGIVIIWGFINDIFRSDRAVMEQTVASIKNNYEAMVNLARKHGITPILATEITLSRRPGFKEKLTSLLGKLAGKTSYQEYINGQVMAVNSWLQGYASQNNVPLLDLQALLADGGAMRNSRYAQPDGSHVSDEGYRVIADYLERQLTALP